MADDSKVEAVQPGECLPGSKSHYHEELKELNEMKSIISSVENIYSDQIAVEMAVERFVFIVDQYQEQPHLLDPHLESLLEQLLNIVRNPNALPEVIHLAFKMLYLVTKTRGYKVIVRMMPHEVADLEPVLAILKKQDKFNHETWEVQYMLLLWLSIVSMIPFDMVRLDSNIRTMTGESKKPIMDRIIEAGKQYLDTTGKSQQAAAYMLSRFMTRPDVKKEKLPEFLDWAVQTMITLDSQTMVGMQTLLGIMTTLAMLFKHGKRDDLMPCAPIILEKLISLKLTESNNTLLRKLYTKNVQRLGLTFLKARVAAWRYQRGSRSLAENLSQVNSSLSNKTSLPMEQDEEYDIPDEMEEVIEQLLRGLKDKDTIVRWSAAKGIGRVTGRLPKELADEVVESIMELFTSTETDAAWHGGCLALAELGRRGLLLPQRLPDVVPVILKALTFDEKRGTFSVGSHVRDAACYVCWAFARAYDPQEMKPHVNKIANALVIVSVFDRQVNVRRAAAAAFQENVGRQGQFPHGIDILTTCDYFAVGQKTHCYLELSVFVAQFPEYTESLIDHLTQIKVSHWDASLRELTAQALHNLTPKAPEYMAKTALPYLVSKTTNMDLNLRHGSILAVAEIIHALSKVAAQQGKTIRDLISAECVQDMRDLTSKLQEAKLFRGFGGEYMRMGICHFINKLSQAKMPYHEDPVIEIWQDFIDDCLQYDMKEIQGAAIVAIPAFCNEYYQSKDGSVKAKLQEKVVEKYLQQLKSNQEFIRMGFCGAIGALPELLLSGHLKPVLGGLIQATKITDKDVTWAEARQDAIKALSSVCSTVGVVPDGNPSEVVCRGNVDEIYDCLLVAMNDYTLDSRGDVGAWVREASMFALHDITSAIVKTDLNLISPEVTKHLFTCLVQQSSEKIDRTRATAGEIFAKLLHHSPEVPHILHREDLKKLFPKEETEEMNWAIPSATFPKFTQLLSIPAYRYNTLLGLTVSVGGLTESIVKHSSAALLAYLRGLGTDKEALQTFTSTLMGIFKDYQKVDRVTLPMLKMLDQLLANGCFDLLAEEGALPVDLFNICKTEIIRSGDPQKLLGSIDVFCGLLQFPGEVRKKSLTHLVIFLCHKYPKIRRTAANKLYEALVSYDDVVDDENMEEIMAILSDTQWDEPVNVVRPIRNQLCDLIKIPRPVMKSKPEKGDGDAAKKPGKVQYLRIQ